MRFAELTSVAHNLATSLSDGGSFLFGAMGINVHKAAAQSPNGRLIVDLLHGDVLEGDVSSSLREIFEKSPQVLADLGRKHHVIPDEFSKLEASFGIDRVYGPHFTVFVEDKLGHRSEEVYAGISGRRLRRGHKT